MFDVPNRIYTSVSILNIRYNIIFICEKIKLKYIGTRINE